MTESTRGSSDPLPLGSEMPEGVRFVGAPVHGLPGWPLADAPSRDDIVDCVACGLCLPHCPTYRLTQDESASPRGRIAAMRAVSEGRAPPDATFASFMDLCLVCRACEEVCPSHVQFGRMMERARVQVEPQRSAVERVAKKVLLDFALPRRWALVAGAALSPALRRFLPRNLRALLPGIAVRDLIVRLPRHTEAQGRARGTVALLAGCAQDAWFRHVNLATVRVLSRNGWEVVVPKGQTCCGALQAHHGHLETARTLARRELTAFDDVDWVIVNSAGCSAHMREYAQLFDADDGGVAEMETARARRLATKVRDLMVFLDEQGVERAPTRAPTRIAYHDACHASHAQGIRDEPRRVLTAASPDIQIVEIPDGERCCGAGGMYNVLQPGPATLLGRSKADAIASVSVDAVCSANPGCNMQIAAHLREQGAAIPVLHPVELLDRAYRGS